MFTRTILSISLILTTAAVLSAQVRQPTASFAAVGDVRAATAGIHFTKAEALTAAQLAERHAFELLNAKRADAGLSPLEWCDQAAEVARGHSLSMSAENYFSHQGLDGSLVNDRAERLGLKDWAAIGENIAFVRTMRDPVEVAVEQWMRSPSHRENILGPRWAESGIGVSVTEQGTFYFTQVFIVRKK